MLRFRDLSLRYKIPLRVVALVLVTAFAVTATLVFREHDQIERDLVAQAQSTGRVLAETLIVPIVHDDLWRAYEVINAPFQAAPADAHDPVTADALLVLDAHQHVYVSTRPAVYPVLSDPALGHPEYAAVQHAISEPAAPMPQVVEPPGTDKLFVLTPIVSDGVRLGTLVAEYTKSSVFAPPFYTAVTRAGLMTMLVLALLLPASWYWGQRTGHPLIQLAGYMEIVGKGLPDENAIRLYESHDEIGQLGAAFKRMLRELREKQDLERQMIASERLAAIGRLTAAIAHEINNPLGGMLNAINTYQRHGQRDPVTDRTLSLLERGLRQIQDTVAALLVEARIQSHSLTPQDIEDTHTLVLPDARKKAAQLLWENAVKDPLPLPSTLVRQVLINLLLNAVQAIEPNGRVECRVYRADRRLHIVTRNDGRYIPSEHLPYLFEPFSRANDAGHGLGLWVTYQIVRQLDGRITVASAPGDTRFDVELPLRNAA